LRKKSLHINRFLSFVLLWVFFIALTPWAALHHHAEVNLTCSNEPVCKHKVHIGTHQEQCLVCAAHFEKNFTQTYHYFHLFFNDSPYVYSQPETGGSYTQLIATALRGPPVV